MPSTTKTPGKKTVAYKFDKLKYAALLVENLPRPIQTEAENERALKAVERLCAKAELSPEEETLLEMLCCLIRAFEDHHYSIPKAAPARVLRLLLENRNLRANDLAPVIGSQRALNAILSGKRAPDPDEAQRLGDFFNLAPATFRALENKG
jgi:HTH-type transcriptional regulator / antitoxin HigA